MIDEARFARIRLIDRLQLLAHEHLHFINSEGSPLLDAGTIGPFTGKEGSRHFIDAVSATYAYVALSEHQLHGGDTIVSRSSRNIYISINAGDEILSSSFRKDSLFKNERLDFIKMNLPWFPRVTDNLGWSVHRQWTSVQSQSLLKASIIKSQWDLGADYRILPFNTELRFFDSVQLYAHLGIINGEVQQKLEDNYIHLSDSTSYWGATLDAKLMIPFLAGFWIEIGTGLQYAPYKLKNLKIDQPSSNHYNFYGVSYGFQI